MQPFLRFLVYLTLAGTAIVTVVYILNKAGLL